MTGESEINLRVWKGVWIPAVIWLSEELNWTEKCLLAEISCLDHPQHGCTASNQYLGKMFQKSPAAIANILSNLRALGWILTTDFNGRKRVMRVNADLTNSLMQGSQIREGSLNESMNQTGPPYISKNIEENIEEKMVCAQAGEVYDLYPKKVGRPVALKKISKAIKDHGFELVKIATIKFAQAWNGASQADKQYCPMPATWFGQERFKDDPSTWQRSTGKRHIPEADSIQETFDNIPGLYDERRNAHKDKPVTAQPAPPPPKYRP